MEIIPQLIVNSIIAGAIYSMIAIGFNLIYGTVRFFDLSYGALIPVGGYGVYYLFKVLGLNFYLSVIISIIISSIVAYLIYRFIYISLKQRRSSSMVFLVASLGVFTAIQSVIAMLFTSQFQTFSRTGDLEKVYSVYTGLITQTQIIILAFSFLIMVVIALFLKYTLFGKAIKAVADDEEVSKIVGINTSKIIGAVFLIGGAISGLSGIFVGLDTGIEPTMGMSLLLKGVIATIVGGIGNIYGGVLGAFFLGFIENFGIWKISGEWKDSIAFGILIIFLLFRPQGILKK